MAFHSTKRNLFSLMSLPFSSLTRRTLILKTDFLCLVSATKLAYFLSAIENGIKATSFGLSLPGKQRKPRPSTIKECCHEG